MNTAHRHSPFLLVLVILSCVFLHLIHINVDYSPEPTCCFSRTNLLSLIFLRSLPPALNLGAE